MTIACVYFNQGFLRGRDAANPLITPSHATSAGVNLGNQAKVGAVLQILSQLNDISMAWRLQNELNQIKPSCDANIVRWANNAPDGKCYQVGSVSIGTIIHAIIAEYSQAIGMANVHQFWTMFQGDIGFDPDATITQYLKEFLKKRPVYPPVPGNPSLKWLLLWYWYE